jgi:hypothetical protein
MKVAYIFHGHSRTWNQCYENFFKNVHSVIPGDIFMHTWNQVNSPTASYWKKWKYNSNEREISLSVPDFNGIYGAYKPKILLIENNPENPASSDSTDFVKSHYGAGFMLGGSRKIFEMACKYGDYDFFVSTRMDIDYTSQFDIAEITNLESNSLLSPIARYPSDIWMIGARQAMDIKTNYFFNIKKYWYDKPNFPSEECWYEGSFGEYLRDNNVKVIQSNLQSKMIRLF